MGMVAHAYNPGTQEAGAQDHKLQASLDDIVKQNKTHSNT